MEPVENRVKVGKTLILTDRKALIRIKKRARAALSGQVLNGFTCGGGSSVDRVGKSFSYLYQSLYQSP